MLLLLINLVVYYLFSLFNYFTDNAAVNKTSYPMEIYAQNTQPSAAAGKTIIWIDTSN